MEMKYRDRSDTARAWRGKVACGELPCLTLPATTTNSGPMARVSKTDNRMPTVAPCAALIAIDVAKGRRHKFICRPLFKVGAAPCYESLDNRQETAFDSY
jgi:hypothetical protein